jgi:hypothetical protein
VATLPRASWKEGYSGRPGWGGAEQDLAGTLRSFIPAVAGGRVPPRGGERTTLVGMPNQPGKPPGQLPRMARSDEQTVDAVLVMKTLSVSPRRARSDAQRKFLPS